MPISSPILIKSFKTNGCRDNMMIHARNDKRTSRNANAIPVVAKPKKIVILLGCYNENNDSKDGDPHN
jgi:hypothetical protein